MSRANTTIVRYLLPAAALSVFAGGCSQPNGATAAGSNPVALNLAAPQVKGTSLLKPQNVVGTVPLKGRVSILEFGTLTRNNRPVLEQWRQRYPLNRVNVAGVYAPPQLRGNTLKELSRPTGMESAKYAVLLDTVASLRQKWQKGSGPTTYLIDRNAKVRYRFEGDLSANNGNGAAKMTRLIEQLLTEPAATLATKKGKIMSDKITRTDAEWRAILTPEQYDVLRRHGTERAGTGALLNEHGQGVFLCAGCGNELFSSETKFESGTGWPSFYKPIDNTAVEEKTDNSYGMQRVEILCQRCGGHLGHVFEDGPQPTGLRYCMNSAAMKFEKK